MEHDTRDEHGFAVVALHGDIDFHSSPVARKVLLNLVGAERDVLVEMADVKYIDSSGVASLIEAFQAAKSAGTRFGLVSVSAAVLKVLKLAHLEKVFPIFQNVAEGAGGRS